MIQPNQLKKYIVDSKLNNIRLTSLYHIILNTYYPLKTNNSPKGVIKLK